MWNGQDQDIEGSNDFNDWFDKFRIKYGPDGKDEASIITMCSFYKGKWNMPDSALPEFCKKYGYTMKLRPWKCFKIEAAGVIIRFTQDFDMTGPTDVTLEEFRKLTKIECRVMRGIFPKGNFKCAILKAPAKKIEEEGKPTLYKCGFHVHWTNVVIERFRAAQINQMMMDAIIAECGLRLPPANAWDKVMDDHIFKNGQLRLPWGRKCTACTCLRFQERKNSKGKTFNKKIPKPDCPKCQGLGAVIDDRFYEPVAELDDQGEIVPNSPLLRLFEDDPPSAIRLLMMRVPLDTPVRDDMIMPANAPDLNPEDYMKQTATTSFGATGDSAAGSKTKKRKKPGKKNAPQTQRGYNMYVPDMHTADDIAQMKIRSEFKGNKVEFFAGTPEYRAMTELMREHCPKEFKGCSIKKLFTGVDRLIWVISLSGPNHKLCLNIDQAHGSNHSYWLYFARQRQFVQKCFSTSDRYVRCNHGKPCGPRTMSRPFPTGYSIDANDEHCQVLQARPQVKTKKMSKALKGTMAFCTATDQEPVAPISIWEAVRNATERDKGLWQSPLDPHKRGMPSAAPSPPPRPPQHDLMMVSPPSGAAAKQPQPVRARPRVGLALAVATTLNVRPSKRAVPTHSFKAAEQKPIQAAKRQKVEPPKQTPWRTEWQEEDLDALGWL